jgi:hypothetical protein
MAGRFPILSVKVKSREKHQQEAGESECHMGTLAGSKKVIHNKD